MHIWITTAINAILLFILGYIIKWAVDRIGKDISKVDKFSDDLERVKNMHRQTESAIYALFSKLQTSHSSLIDGVSKLRRSVVSGSLLIRRRKAEISEIVENASRLKSDLSKAKQIIASGIDIAKAYDVRLKKIENQSTIIKVGQDVYIVKGEKKNKNV